MTANGRTDELDQVLTAARRLADAWGDAAVGAAHVLMAIAASKGEAGRCLATMGVTAEAVVESACRMRAEQVVRAVTGLEESCRRTAECVVAAATAGRLD